MNRAELKVIETHTPQGNEKIKSIEDVAGVLEYYRTENKKIVLCHGVFDLLHIGHIRYFEQAHQMGDILVVTITPDRFVDKGPNRPAFTEILRAEAVASLSCVDYVAINEWPTAEETLLLFQPDVYVKGSEFKNSTDDITGKVSREEQVVHKINAKMAFTEDIVFSSSNLINRYLSNLPREMNQYLDLFRQRYTLKNLTTILDRMTSLNVLVIGDTILDEYQYCDALGKSSKDPTLVLQYQSHDMFAGGVLAVANHVANFVNSVQLVSVIGTKNSHEKFIRSQLHPRVRPVLFSQPDAPTLIKRRFLDGYSFNKLFEVYVMDDSGLPAKQHIEACNWLSRHIRDYDLVIAADFGHGTISRGMIKLLSDESKFLAVNTQANAGNRGFHTISRYPRTDYACIAEHELYLETRTQGGKLLPLMADIAKQLSSRQFVVTRGRKGCAVLGNEDFTQIPAFALRVVDRVGAGDAFLSVTSLAAVQDVPNEIIGFLGNVTGALAVECIGNKKAIDKLSLHKYITSLLK